MNKYILNMGIIDDPNTHVFGKNTVKALLAPPHVEYIRGQQEIYYKERYSERSSRSHRSF